MTLDLHDQHSQQPTAGGPGAVGICLASAAGDIGFVNDEICALIGCPRDDLIGRELAHLLRMAGCSDPAGSLAELASGNGRLRLHGRLGARYGSDTSTEVDLVLDISVVQGKDGTAEGSLLEMYEPTARYLNAELVRQAMHDPLTELPNRLLFMDRLTSALARGPQPHAVTAVMFIDLDDFKDVNDGHGHDVGDEVLVQTALRLAEVVRPSDTVARLGGDEFVILCVDLPDAADAARIAERLLVVLAAPIAVGSDEVVVTSSIGIATTGPGSSQVSAEEILHEADSALYRAKAKGKNQVEVFGDELRTSVHKRVTTEAMLRRSLRESHFELHYQPIYELASGNLVAVEALIRLRHGEQGLLLPEQFMDVAEHSGLIVPIGAWVLQESCLQLAQWRADGVLSNSVRVAVNLSERQVSRSDLLQAVRYALDAAELEPNALSLELTESIFMDGDSSHVRQLDELRRMGVTIEIDDFGTGYSSLAYLKHLPVSVIKVDRSFVSGILSNESDRGIASSVIGLGQALGLTTIAEGVENAAQLDALWVLGCDQVQGYHLGRPAPAPLPPAAVTDWGEIPTAPDVP